MSQRTLYRLVDSNTGGDKEVGEWHVGHIFEVIETRPIVGGGGILYKSVRPANRRREFTSI